MVLIGEDEQIARLLEIKLRGKESRGLDPVFFPDRRKIGEGGRHQGAPDAIADGGDFLLPEGGLNRVEGGKNALGTYSSRRSCRHGVRRD